MNTLKKDIETIHEISSRYNNLENKEEFSSLWNKIMDQLKPFSYPKPFLNEIWAVIVKIPHPDQNKYVTDFKSIVLGN